MPKDAIQQIELAQQRLKAASRAARQVMERQRARLEANRKVIDWVTEHAHSFHRRSHG